MSLLSKFAAAAVATLSLGSSAALAFPIAAPGSEGFSVVVGSTGSVTATYQGNSATYSNDLYLVLPGDDLFIFNNHASPVGSSVDLGTFAAGTELVFRLYVNNTGNEFYTGPAARNADGNPHARVQSDWQPGETLVSFEDLFNGPFDYNDLSFSFTNTTAEPAPPAVPVPAAGLLLAGGLGVMALRRKRG